MVDSNFFGFTYLVLQRFHATEIILRATLIKHCKQSLDGFLESNGWMNMLFALIFFFKLVVEKSEKCLGSCSSLGSSDEAIGFSDKVDLKIMGKILQITDF